MKKVRSWEYDMSKNIAIKKLDKSSFKSGSHIPIEIREFFNCENISYGIKKQVLLEYLGDEYTAYIEKGKNGKVRIRWSKIIPLLKERFKFQYDLLEIGQANIENIPKIEFTKIDSNRYDLNLYDSEIQNIDKFFYNIGIDTSTNDEDMLGEIKTYLTKGRKNHNKYREKLIQKECKCKICGLDDRRLLIASHSKEWRVSTPLEKVDVNNGFLLCPNHDILYDRHLVSFDDEGKILISKSIDENNYFRLGVDKKIKINISKEELVYVKYHRKKFLINEKELFNCIKSKEIDKFEITISI